VSRAHDLYIGNTDHDWFNFCKSQEQLEEVNFWQPSAKKFRVIEEGGIFFFRRKAPINLIGGFGILAASENASIGLLWDDLGLCRQKKNLLAASRNTEKQSLWIDQLKLGSRS